MKKIDTVGVVGAGTMGSAIAQKFSQEGFKLILSDRELQYVENGINDIKSTLQEGVERRLFNQDQVDSILSNIQLSSNLEDLKGCDLIIEAIYEDFDAKSELFQKLAEIVDENTILATNTSSFSISEIAKSVSHPERFIGMHYFFHAAKNRLVEIIPGEKTSDETYKAMQIFSVQSGKDAITTTDSNGFAVNRFFVPWLNEAVRLLEENIATIPEIDKVCMKSFGIGLGPFALMNATGVPIAYHAQKTLEVYGDLYKTSDLLKTQTDSGNEWNLGGVESADPESDIAKQISDRMLGIVFYVGSQILTNNICSAVDLNRGARIGLRWREGPVELMQRYGANEVEKLVQLIAGKYRVQVPEGINEAAWQMDFVQMEKSGNRAIIRMSKPEDMNALDVTVMNQLNDKFTDADSDSQINTIYITGIGKAFVAGADIRFFLKNMKAGTLENIVNFTKFGQLVFEKIDKSAKKVVAVLNGLTLGGGLELALCADMIIAVPDALMAFPETGIGIYPGLGGTQRTAKKIGKGLSKFLIYAGQMLNSTKALEIGLIDAIVKPSEVFDLFSGVIEIPVTNEHIIGEDFNSLRKFFEYYSIHEILEGISQNELIPSQNAENICKKISFKAPIALKTAEKLINDAAGCESELNELEMIFSTEDALTGLSSIGKKVQFAGK